MIVVKPESEPCGYNPHMPDSRVIPSNRDTAFFDYDGKRITLTNLRKPFWPALGITKGDLIQYYLEVSPWLLPHIADRPMVMKRYPDGAGGDFFFMKQTPTPRPEWIRTHPIDHGDGKIVDYPVVDDLPTLLWAINLGCIDLNPWYSRCDDIDRPDWLHFDLDPSPGATFASVREAALVVRDALESLAIPCHAKTTGSRGIHVYVPIRRGPHQKDVWAVSKAVAIQLAARRPKLLTSEYRKTNRKRGTVLVDYNQNAWGQTLASIYSVRPTPAAGVSMPVTWREVEDGIEIEAFTLRNAKERLDSSGDLWKPLLGKKRFDLEKFVATLNG